MGLEYLDLDLDTLVAFYGKVGIDTIHGWYALGIQSPCQMMIGVYNHLLRKVFRFHYHSQKVIGSLGMGYKLYGSCFVPSLWVDMIT